MTKGDRDKPRAEIAGRVLAAIIVEETNYHAAWETESQRRDRQEEAAILRAGSLLNALGLSEEAEAAAIRKMADELKSVP